MTNGIIVNRSRYPSRHASTHIYKHIAIEDGKPNSINYEHTDTAHEQRRKFKKIDRMLDQLERMSY